MAWSKKNVRGKYVASVLKKPSFKRKSSAARIKGAIAAKQELKFVDIASASYGATGGTVTLLNGIAEGDDYSTRDGRQATMRSVHIRGSYAPNPTAAPTTAALGRILLVWDNAPKGSLATIAEVLTAAVANSFPLVDNQERFTILRDTHYGLDPANLAATTTLSYRTYPVDTFVKLDSVTQYNGTGATIASIQNGALLLIVLQDGWSGNVAARCELATRVRFSEP